MKRISFGVVVLFLTFFFVSQAHAVSDAENVPAQDPETAGMTEPAPPPSPVPGLPPQEVQGTAYDPSQITTLPGKPVLSSAQRTRPPVSKQPGVPGPSSENTGDAGGE